MPYSPTSRATSAEAYRWVMDNVSAPRKRVIYEWVHLSGPCTDSEIADALGIPRDSASPRVRDLLRIGALVELPEPRPCRITGARCRVVDVSASVPTPSPTVPRTDYKRAAEKLRIALTWALAHGDFTRAHPEDLAAAKELVERPSDA